MLNDIEAGKIKVVVVKDLSRFGREYAQMGMYIEHYFEEKGVRFISVAENIDTKNGVDSLVLPFTNVINSFYARQASSKTKAAHRARAKEGIFIGIRQFLPLIQKYTDIQELNAHILNELIEKIVVHEKEIGADGTKTQQVDIYYRFIGYVNWRDMGQNSAGVFLLPGPEGSDAAEND